MEIVIILLATIVATAGATIWLMNKRSTGTRRAQPRETAPIPAVKYPPRANFLDEIKQSLEIGTDGRRALHFRFISQTNLFEVKTALVIANHSMHTVKVSRISWDVWVQGTIIKHGDYCEPVELEAGKPEKSVVVREVLKESEAADLSWSTQRTAPTCYVEGTVFYDTPFGKDKKMFSLLNMTFDLNKEKNPAGTAQFVKEAYVDGLTGLLQRKFIEDNLQTMIDRNVHLDPMSLVMIDIDEFKSINDQRGHLAGDEVIKLVSSRIRAIVGDRGFCVRYGGDEICVILENCALAEAKALAEQILTEIRQSDVLFENEPIRFSVSIGIAAIAEKAPYKSLIRHADEMLLFSKKTGKNKISVDNRRISQA